MMPAIMLRMCPVFLPRCSFPDITGIRLLAPEIKVILFFKWKCNLCSLNRVLNFFYSIRDNYFYATYALAIKIGKIVFLIFSLPNCSKISFLFLFF